MTKPFYALITPIDPGLHPSHPIAPGGSPPGIWGPNDPRPTPPIVIPQPPGGGPPLVIWGPPGPWPTPPIVIPLPPIDAHPEHPIVIPPPPEEGEPPGIWGPFPGFPTPPIVIPPTDPGRTPVIDWGVVWSPENGWQVVGTPNVPHPAPAGGRRGG